MTLKFNTFILMSSSIYSMFLIVFGFFFLLICPLLIFELVLEKALFALYAFGNGSLKLALCASVLEKLK